jgi:Domain of unknown function (DUF4470)
MLTPIKDRVCHAGRPEPPAPDDVDRLGAISAEGQLDGAAHSGPDSQISLAPPDDFATAADGGSARRDVGVLLGGCGDARHLLATLLDAADPARCAQPDKLALRFVLIDVCPEVVARAYVLLVLLERAVQTLSSSEPPDDVYGMDDKTSIALATVWHVYMAPTLCDSAYSELVKVLEEAAESPEPTLDFVRCTAGTWDAVRQCCQGWAQHEISLEAERRYADMYDASAAAMSESGPIAEAMKVRCSPAI